MKEAEISIQDGKLRMNVPEKWKIHEKSATQYNFVAVCRVYGGIVLIYVLVYTVIYVYRPVFHKMYFM